MAIQKPSVEFILMMVALAIAPWFFGGSDPLFLRWLLMTTLLASVFLAARLPLLRSGRAKGLRWMFLPMAGVVGLALIQQLPLSSTTVTRLSPESQRQWQRADASISEDLVSKDQVSDSHVSDSRVSDTHRERTTISLYPWSTRLELAQFAFPVAIFALASYAAVNKNHCVFGCAFFAINGVLFSLFGIAQRLTFNGRIYWLVDMSQGGHPFAAFVNQNNAGGYLNLCLAASICWLYWATIGSDGQIKADRQWSKGLSPLQMNAIGASISTLVIFAGVLATMSRGAAVSLFVAIVVTTVCLVAITGSKRVLKTSALFVLVGLVLFVVLVRADEIFGQWDQTVSELREGRVARIEHWHDALATYHQYPVFGAGLGTYRFAYQPNESRQYAGVYHHAENQYVEALVVGGAIGLALMMTCLLIAILAALRGIRSPCSTQRALGIGAFFAIVSQSVHACFDFGLYMPANAGLLAAIISQVGAFNENPANVELNQDAKGTQMVPRLLLLCVALFSGWAFFFLYSNAEAIDAARDTIQRVENQEVDDESSRRLKEALESTPGFAEGHYAMARSLIRDYEVEVKSQLNEQLSGQDFTEEMENLATLMAWHRTNYQLLAKGEQSQLDSLRESHAVSSSLKQALEHLFAAKWSCAVLSRVDLELAQLINVEEGDWKDEAHVARTLELAPYDSGILYIAGLIDMQAGRNQRGLATWKHCLALSAKFAPEIIQVGSSLMDPDELLDAVLPANAENLLEIADESAHLSAKAKILTRAKSAVAETTLEPTIESYMRGRIASHEGESETAIKYLEEAVAASPDLVDWRICLVNELVIAGELDQAERHIRLCIASRPKSERFRHLLRKIIRRQSDDAVSQQ